MDNKTRLQANNTNLNEILSAINDLPEASTSGGIDTSDATATAADILSDKTAYVDGEKITGTIPSQTAKTITPTTTSQTAIAAGTYASGNVTVDGDADLVASNIKSGVSIFGVDGSYTSDATATAADIAEGKTAYVDGEKITGTHICPEGEGGIDTSDATATSADIATGKIAYVNGEKVTGSMVVQSYYVSNVAPSSTLGNDGDLCLVRAGE